MELTFDERCPAGNHTDEFTKRACVVTVVNKPAVMQYEDDSMITTGTLCMLERGKLSDVLTALFSMY